jgi:hypothetical protein
LKLTKSNLRFPWVKIESKVSQLQTIEQKKGKHAVSTKGSYSMKYWKAWNVLHVLIIRHKFMKLMAAENFQTI